MIVGYFRKRSSILNPALCFLLAASVIIPLGLPVTGEAGCGWSAIDHKISRNESGIWNPAAYRTVLGVLSMANLGGALWEGSESDLGKTLWKGADAQIIAATSATGMKYVFTRRRPGDTDNSCEWFAGGQNDSFPSTEAALSASLVTPFIMEYAGEHPEAYGLLLVPMYVGFGRVRNQAHWQTDVLAGWLAGGLSGWFAHSRKTPLLVQILPHGVIVGLKTRF
jgi:undecaprenyl-diphosphatase